MTAFTPIFAYILDLLFGDPDWIYKKVWHPVIVPGKLASFVDGHMNRWPQARWSILAGFVSTAFILLIVLALIFAFEFLTHKLSWVGWLIEILFASTLIAHTSLTKFVLDVGTKLKNEGLKGGQNAVQHLVSRNADTLDESGVCRSAIESLSENFSDAVVAPLFWFVIFGLPGLAAYKTINTLDSMWGYRNEKYEYFGKFAARLDDVVNWLPARLSALIVLLSALQPRLANKVVNNAPLHRSPNAGWPESAFAYVLNIKLSGPRVYDEGLYKGPWMGDGRETLNAADIDKAVDLFQRTKWLIMCLLMLAGTLKYVI